MFVVTVLFWPARCHFRVSACLRLNCLQKFFLDLIKVYLQETLFLPLFSSFEMKTTMTVKLRLKVDVCLHNNVLYTHSPGAPWLPVIAAIVYLQR